MIAALGAGDFFGEMALLDSSGVLRTQNGSDSGRSPKRTQKGRRSCAKTGLGSGATQSGEGPGSWRRLSAMCRSSRRNRSTPSWLVRRSCLLLPVLSCCLPAAALFCLTCLPTQPLICPLVPLLWATQTGRSTCLGSRRWRSSGRRPTRRTSQTRPESRPRRLSSRWHERKEGTASRRLPKVRRRRRKKKKKKKKKKK